MLEHEKKIIRKAQEGDSESFGLLYDEYVKPIYRFVAIKVTGRHAAEDITHEIFLAAWQNIGSYTYRGLPFSSWLYQIARNRVIDYYRQRRPALSIDDLVEENVILASTHNEDAERALTLRRVRSFLHELTDDQKDVVIMRFLEDRTPREIALALSKSEGAIRVIQHRAVLRLKNLFHGTEPLQES